MSQLTRQDIAEVVEEVLDRVLDRKLDQKLEERLGLKPGETLDEKLDSKLGAFVEHLDHKFDSLAEVVSLMNTNMQGLAKQSDLQTVRNDIKIIKRAVKDTNDDLRHLGKSF